MPPRGFYKAARTLPDQVKKKPNKVFHQDPLWTDELLSPPPRQKHLDLCDIHKIGEGTHAKVYRAFNSKYGFIAVKRVKSTILETADTYWREVCILNKLNNHVSMFMFGQSILNLTDINGYNFPGKFSFPIWSSRL